MTVGPIIPSPVRPAPLEPTTPIRPSEAIRLGCLIAPRQHRYSMFGRHRSACALGAMARGFGYVGNRGEDAFDLLIPRFPVSLHDPFTGNGGSAVGVISRLNDAKNWSRERIADWLEGLGL